MYKQRDALIKNKVFMSNDQSTNNIEDIYKKVISIAGASFIFFSGESGVMNNRDMVTHVQSKFFIGTSDINISI